MPETDGLAPLVLASLLSSAGSNTGSNTGLTAREGAASFPGSPQPGGTSGFLLSQANPSMRKKVLTPHLPLIWPLPPPCFSRDPRFLLASTPLSPPTPGTAPFCFPFYDFFQSPTCDQCRVCRPLCD